MCQDTSAVARALLELTCRVGGWRQPLPEALLQAYPVYHHRVCCPRTRRLHLPSGLSQDRDRPQLDHQAHRSLVVGRDSPVADALRAAGSDHGDLAADVPEAGREKCCGSDRMSAGTGLAAAHRSRAGEAAHMGHAKAEDRGSTVM
jgi:hypothetical protein